MKTAGLKDAWMDLPTMARRAIAGGLLGAAAGATEGFGYGCDPADRNDSVIASGQVVVQDAYPTHLKVAMPFIITDI